MSETKTFTEAEMVAEAQRGLTPEQWKRKDGFTQIGLISSARARLEKTGRRLVLDRDRSV